WIVDGWNAMSCATNNYLLSTNNHSRLKKTAKHIHQRLAASFRAQFGKRAFETQPALMEKPKTIAKSLGFVQTMRAYDHRLPLVAKPTHVVDHDLTADHVQAARWFVEQH